MDTVYRWLIGDMGIPGNYQYQPLHWYSLTAIALVWAIILARAIRNRRTGRSNRRMLVAISVFQLGFEVLWRLIYVFVKGDSILCWWPLYPCNVGGILLPLFALTRNQTGKRMFYVFGFVGGVLTFAIPEGIFSSNVLVFPIVKSLLQHTGLLLIPTVELVSGTYRPTLRDMGWIFGGCLIHLFNCEVIDRLLGFTGDYMFYRSGLPFVIPGVPQFITLTIFGLLVLSAICFLCDVNGSIRFLRTLHPVLRLRQIIA